MPWDYTAPLREMRFVIERVLNAPASWAQCPALADTDLATCDAVLHEAARFARGELLPLNASGDAEGCRLTPDGVQTPQGFAAAYQAFVQGGWPALPVHPDWGGQGLPLLLDAAVREMLVACNHGWVMYPDLLHGAYETLRHHASPELQQRYLAGVASGETLAAMALTEPQAGSDLGALTTQAHPQPDGSLRVSGSKIFISGADHDLTHQIVHLVLCRLPGAPAGSKGLSLALVPKWLPDGRRNAWAVDGLEHKLGIHGSATCAVRYDGATGWLVGEPNRGLAAMFLMMNSARLHVGLQGLGHQEAATQNALAHAAERTQFGRPIAQHPAMRHTLQRLAALTEAQRTIAYRGALALDEAEHHANPEVRRAQHAQAALLTPIVKALLTQQGFDSASRALQVFGGYGYTRDYGIEQTLRDSRIAMVYEGTNEIQAIDLLQRKVLGDGGVAFAALLQSLEAEAEQCAATPGLADAAEALRGQINSARRAVAAVQQRAAADASAALNVADAFMRAASGLLLCWAWAAGARAAVAEAATDAAWAEGKVARMRYGWQWVLPEFGWGWALVWDEGLRSTYPV